MTFLQHNALLQFLIVDPVNTLQTNVSLSPDNFELVCLKVIGEGGNWVSIETQRQYCFTPVFGRPWYHFGRVEARFSHTYPTTKRYTD